MNVEPDTPLILASASPRRRELLALTGLDFQIAPGRVAETPGPGELPEAYAGRMSREKAAAAQAKTAGGHPRGLIVAADTDVALGGRILGKPARPAEARAMLRDLRGKAHHVFSAITVIDPASGRALTDLACTEVPMRAYTDQEIEDYIASGDPFDKAGAYAIQHPRFQPAEDLQGCYANVMGLPLCHLTRTLGRLAVIPPRDVARACQEHTGYNCPVYRNVLAGGA
jgi:MAF protein